MGGSCDDVCFAYYSVYRLGIALAAFHLLQSLLLVGVSSPENRRAVIQNDMWLLKIIALIGLAVGSFWLPRPFLNVMFYPAVVMGSIFLLIQAILLVDLAYSWTETLLDEAAEDGTAAKVLLFGSTLLFGLMTIAGLVAIYVYFDGNLERSLLPINALFLVAMAICSVLPSVQEANPSAGLFQCSLLGLYSIFIVLSALIGDPNRQAGTSVIAHYPRLSRLVLVASVIFSFLTLAQSAISTGDNLHRMVPEDREPGPAPTDEDSGGYYNYALFHLGFAMAAFFTILYITFWQYAFKVGNAIQISTSSASFWFRWGSSWLVCLLYLWSLFAPIVLESRDF